jgi:hypothetical protein
MNLKSLSWIVCTATLLVAVEANAQRTPRRRAGAPAPATTQPEVPYTCNTFAGYHAYAADQYLREHAVRI